VIEDLDGPDRAPDRRRHVLVISVLLLLGVVAGYAAVSSPELRGPYATPRPLPSVVNAPRSTPAPIQRSDPASVILFRSADCVDPGAISPTTISANAQRVTTLLNGSTVTTILPNAGANPCAVWWGQPPNPIPYDRIAR
jgi:hypothetical protein